MKILKIIGVISVFIWLSPGLSHADKIYLKDGKCYEGKLVGRSDRRYLFNVRADGESMSMSFFPEDIEKIELDKNTVEEQIPYLKDVESLRVQVTEGRPKIYELSLYRESQIQAADSSKFTEKDLEAALTKQEREYYKKFNAILKRYVDKFQVVGNLYMSLTTATREDFAQAKQYMDELYFELNNIYVPEAFKRTHGAYLESVKASFLAFTALEQGMLDEASKQIKVSEETKQHSMNEFRSIIVARKPGLAPQ